MKVEILQEELLRAVTLVLRAVSSRSQLPILTCIKLEAAKTELILTASDLEIGIRCAVVAKVIETGVVAIPAKTLSDLLISLRPGKMSLEVEGTELKVVASGFKGELLIQGAAEFPILPEVGEPILIVKGEALLKATGRVSFASAKDSLRPVLTGTMLELTTPPQLVATDGFRLAVSSLSIQGAGTSEAKTILLPTRALLEVTRIMKEGEIKVGYNIESRQVIFEQESMLFVSQVIEGNFPDYTKILPKEFECRIEISREDFLASVRTAMVFARDNSQMMRLGVEGGEVVVKAQAGASGSGESRVAAKVEGEGMEVVFNAKYILDYVGLLSSQEIWIGLGGKLAPGMFAESEEKRDEAYYVVMPINA